MATAVETFRELSQPLEPIRTDEVPRLKQLEGIRVVLFDLYGTLLVSGSGEVGTEATPCHLALAEAFRAMGIAASAPPEEAVACFFDTIKSMHRDLRDSGRDWPEIDIREAWTRVLSELVERGGLDPSSREGIDIAQLAVEYEARANPVWPMPGALEGLAALRAGGCLLGIVSNAQFYTLALIEALFGCRAEPLGFDPALQFYSYQHGWGKPSRRLFEMAAVALADRLIMPSEVVFVGNDMLNDIFAARMVGFRTALFAGDARSLRWRSDDPQVKEVTPDLVLTELPQLAECIIDKGSG
ncbi:MAG: HAD family hydrolase [Pirellulales bacterium]|nr:HAD family hydrolase [Pirellulales bacterium]